MTCALSGDSYKILNAGTKIDRQRPAVGAAPLAVGTVTLWRTALGVKGLTGTDDESLRKALAELPLPDSLSPESECASAVTAARVLCNLGEADPAAPPLMRTSDRA